VHGIENFFVTLANGIQSVWRARSLLSRPTLLDDPAAARRSRFAITVLCVIATLFFVAVGAAVIWMFWWAFTIHERR
jgi:hypothetical protein